LGAWTAPHDRGSPRQYAINVRSDCSTSIRSVFALRLRCSTAMLAGSNTWLVIPAAVNKRCSQKPS
jgi:hypothetical protein